MYKNLHIYLMNKHGQIYWGGGVHSIAFYCIPLLFGLGPSLKSRSRLRCESRDVQWTLNDVQRTLKAGFLLTLINVSKTFVYLMTYLLRVIIHFKLNIYEPFACIIIAVEWTLNMYIKTLYIHRMYTRIAKLTQFTKH